MADSSRKARADSSRKARADSSRKAQARRLTGGDPASGRRSHSSTGAGPQQPARAIDGLTILGLRPGEGVRFRRDRAMRWQEAVVAGRERDGSVRLTDGRGAARTISVERIEVRCTGPRGGVAWEPLTDRASRTEQLRLL
jgi:hypothetical protein